MADTFYNQPSPVYAGYGVQTSPYTLRKAKALSPSPYTAPYMGPTAAPAGGTSFTFSSPVTPQGGIPIALETSPSPPAPPTIPPPAPPAPPPGAPPVASWGTSLAPPTYEGPNLSQTDAQQVALLSSLLANPYSLSPDIVNAMKGQQQEQATQMEAQLRGRLGQDVASRGGFGGGYQQATERRMGQDTISNLLGGYRQIDIAKAQQDKQDLLNALGMAENVSGGLSNRALETYRTSQLQPWQTLTDYDRALRQMAIQEALGREGFGIDRSRLAEQQRQFDLAQQLAWAEFLNNMLMGREQLGLSTAQLGQGWQNDFANWFNNWFGR